MMKMRYTANGAAKNYKTALMLLYINSPAYFNALPVDPAGFIAAKKGYHTSNIFCRAHTV